MIEEVDASIPTGMDLSTWCSESFSKSASRSENEEKAMLRANTQRKVFCTRRQQCSSSLFVFVFFLVLSVVRMDFSLFSSRGMV